MACSCHCGRIKRLACQPGNPNLLWSAGEDGLVLQHDTRTSHRCKTDNTNILINLINHMGRYAEAKCLAVNPRRPEMLAVGANDIYVRLYDTRMIKLGRLKYSTEEVTNTRHIWELNTRNARAGLGDPEYNIPRQAVNYYAPGHLAMTPIDQSFPKKSTTYVVFSEDGNELLVNLGSEQIYIYDINTARRPTLLESFIIEHNHGYRNNEVKGGQKNGTTSTNIGLSEEKPTDQKQQCYELPDDVAELKGKANDMMTKNKYPQAVELYNEAIAKCPDCALLYSNRAAALMRRGWSGDTYAAVRDCYAAIRIDSMHVKAHFRLAKALMDLTYAREAHECLLYFKDRFPKHANSHAVFLLQKDINSTMESMDMQADEMMPADAEEQYKGSSLLERQLRNTSLDYSQRFIGHCNTTTDIKEATFITKDYVAAGSDDGNIFIWCRKSGNIIRMLRGDESIVNCIQIHPKTFLIATSGIESVVRLWSPRPEDGTSENRLVLDSHSSSIANQHRMNSDPFEAMLLNISFAAHPESRDPHSCRPT